MPDPLAELCADRPTLRVLVVAAHPDDETVGMAARLARLGPAVTILHVTNGSPANGRDARANGFAKPILYEEARRAELEAAMSVAGINPGQLFSLRRPDQQASLDLVGIAYALAEFVSDARPNVVVTHPYEGGHPDHDATAFAVHASREIVGLSAPPIVEMTSYHMGDGNIAPGTFLPNGGPVTTLDLSPDELDLRRRMMLAYTTQQGTLGYFSQISAERFRMAPAYDFATPPHGGPLWYEKFDWGCTGEQFRRNAVAAAAELVRP